MNFPELRRVSTLPRPGALRRATVEFRGAVIAGATHGLLVAAVAVSSAACQSPAEPREGFTPIGTGRYQEPPPARVVIVPEEARLEAIGAEILFSGVAIGPDDQLLSTAVITWSTPQPTLLSVEPFGLVVALAEGEAEVVATAGSAVARAPVLIRQRVTSIDVVPASIALAPGDQAVVVATARDSLGHAVDRAAEWSAADPSVATVDSTGLVRALGPGVTVVTVTVEGVVATLTVRVAF